VKLTLEEHVGLAKLVRPLQEWLNSNCHPHVKVIMDSETVELMEGTVSIKRTEKK